MTPLFFVQPQEKNISYNEVSGIVIERQGIFYTLNFEQQNQILKYLNEQESSDSFFIKNQQNLDFEKMIIYRFNEPEIVIQS
jgi:hypothetical protein